MNEQELRELEQAENWEYETAKKRPAVKNPRAVVSVAFTREEFARVAAHAEQSGMKVSTLIREAVLEKITRAKTESVTGTISTNPTLVTYVNQPRMTNFIWSEATTIQRPDTVVTGVAEKPR